jgi:hypothetical protein
MGRNGVIFMAFPQKTSFILIAWSIGMRKKKDANF